MRNTKELNKKTESKTEDDLNLYMIYCLKNSGFSDEIAHKLVSKLEDLWVNDEEERSISQISDELYAEEIVNRLCDIEGVNNAEHNEDTGEYDVIRSNYLSKEEIEEMHKGIEKIEQEEGIVINIYEEQED